MEFAQISRDMPERLLLTVRNAYTAALTMGQWVVWEQTATADGAAVTRPATATLGTPAGVVAQGAAAGDYAKICLWGLTEYALVDEAGGGAIAAGTSLILVDAVFSALAFPAAGTVLQNIGICGRVLGRQTAGPFPPPANIHWYRVLVRCL